MFGCCRAPPLSPPPKGKAAGNADAPVRRDRLPDAAQVISVQSPAQVAEEAPNVMTPVPKRTGRPLTALRVHIDSDRREVKRIICEEIDLVALAAKAAAKAALLSARPAQLDSEDDDGHQISSKFAPGELRVEEGMESEFWERMSRGDDAPQTSVVPTPTLPGRSAAVSSLSMRPPVGPTAPVSLASETRQGSAAAPASALPSASTATGVSVNFAFPPEVTANAFAGSRGSEAGGAKGGPGGGGASIGVNRASSQSVSRVVGADAFLFPHTQSDAAAAAGLTRPDSQQSYRRGAARPRVKRRQTSPAATGPGSRADQSPASRAGSLADDEDEEEDDDAGAIHSEIDGDDEDEDDDVDGDVDEASANARAMSNLLARAYKKRQTAHMRKSPSLPAMRVHVSIPDNAPPSPAAFAAAKAGGTAAAAAAAAAAGAGSKSRPSSRASITVVSRAAEPSVAQSVFGSLPGSSGGAGGAPSVSAVRSIEVAPGRPVASVVAIAPAVSGAAGAGAGAAGRGARITRPRSALGTLARANSLEPPGSTAGSGGGSSSTAASSGAGGLAGAATAFSFHGEAAAFPAHVSASSGDLFGSSGGTTAASAAAAMAAPSGPGGGGGGAASQGAQVQVVPLRMPSAGSAGSSPPLAPTGAVAAAAGAAVAASPTRRALAHGAGAVVRSQSRPATRGSSPLGSGHAAGDVASAGQVTHSQGDAPLWRTGASDDPARTSGGRLTPSTSAAVAAAVAAAAAAMGTPVVELVMSPPILPASPGLALLPAVSSQTAGAFAGSRSAASSGSAVPVGASSASAFSGAGSQFLNIDEATNTAMNSPALVTADDIDVSHLTGDLDDVVTSAGGTSGPQGTSEYHGSAPPSMGDYASAAAAAGSSGAGPGPGADARKANRPPQFVFKKAPPVVRTPGQVKAVTTRSGAVLGGSAGGGGGGGGGAGASAAAARQHQFSTPQPSPRRHRKQARYFTFAEDDISASCMGISPEDYRKLRALNKLSTLSTSSATSASQAAAASGNTGGASSAAASPVAPVSSLAILASATASQAHAVSMAVGMPVPGARGSSAVNANLAAARRASQARLAAATLALPHGATGAFPTAPSASASAGSILVPGASGDGAAKAGHGSSFPSSSSSSSSSFPASSSSVGAAAVVGEHIISFPQRH